MGADWGASRVLLLQGPMGPFFGRLADELRADGIAVRHVLFNAGDAWFHRGDGIPYRGSLADWPAFFERLVEAERVDAVMLFGDMRPIHRAVIPLARARGIAVHVFEEGYFRPNFITVERDGVNANSTLPRDPAPYLEALRTLPAPDAPREVGPAFGRMGWYATVYSIAMTFLFFLYPRYEHHRPLNAFVHAASWVRGYLRKRRFLRSEEELHARIPRELRKKFFLLPLQVHNDAQLQHSPYPSIEAFLRDVIAQFSQHASADTHLVVKHHPMDRPFREYGNMLRDLAVEHGLEERLHYVHDPDLVPILGAALGTITMNSTVGLQSLEASVPTKVLGEALYDLPGLTFQGSLAEFLAAPGRVDAELFEGLRRYVVHHTQGNGNFHVPLPSVPGQEVGPSGVLWPKALVARSRSSGVSTPRSGD